MWENLELREIIKDHAFNTMTKSNFFTWRIPNIPDPQFQRVVEVESLNVFKTEVNKKSWSVKVNKLQETGKWG